MTVTGPGAAPLISIVLAVHSVQEYLDGCLDSVLGQQAVPIEVIAVDDASPDRCGAMLDARAQQDPRLRVIHLAASGGPGPARNLGLAQASGDYVWFVDPDDLLRGGAIAAVAAALARSHPDVLLIDYLLLHPSGQTQASPGAGLLRAASPAAGPDGSAGAGPATIVAGTLTLAERPALVNRTMTAWSKVFRREFLAGLPVTFPPGIHEDVPVCTAALLAAHRIGLLDEVCYLYRQRRSSFLAVASMSHFSIFRSYERVFALMRDGTVPPPAGPVRAAVFGRAMEHYSTVLANGLVPRSARRAFFRQMAHDFRRYRPPGYHPPPGLRGMKIALIGLGAYWPYQMLSLLNRARVAARRHPGGR